MAGVWARKKSQEVPIQGVIVNDETMESETDKTLTIDAIKRLTHGNSLIINGDFQINQRGESEYPSGVVKYTVDMWIRWGCAVIAGDNGVTINTIGNTANGAFGQIIERLEVGKKYTVCINITSLSGTGDISIGTRTDFDNVGHSNILKQGVNKITFTATGQWLTVCCKNVLVTIEYIDLFEGSIAYPHVKEDYSIALLRCQRYYEITSTFVSRTYIENCLTFTGIDFAVEKRITPTVKILRLDNASKPLKDYYQSGYVTSKGISYFTVTQNPSKFDFMYAQFEIDAGIYS